MRRREIAGLALLPWMGATAAVDDAFSTALRQGGCVVLFRHARTVPGIGDPAGFRLDTCSGQRNLNDAGRAQARRIGEWFSERQLRPRAVRSSAWCRCKDTAQLAFGSVEVWPPLNSTFDDSALSPAATAKLRDALRALPPSGFEVWVTHQVNITALTGDFASMGEGVLVDRGGVVRARLTVPTLP